MGVVVLSFDDGRIDNYRNVYPLLNKMGLPATFNITTGYIDNTIKTENRFCENQSMAIEHITEIASNPMFEIASHGDNHLNTAKDIQKSMDKLDKWKALSADGIGFASPHHRLEQADYHEIMALKKELGLKYIRIGGRLKKDIYHRACRFVYRQLNGYLMFCVCYGKCVMHGFADDGIYISLPYHKNMAVKDICHLVECEVANRRDRILVLLFHSVIKKGEDFYRNLENIDYDDFKELCIKLRKLSDQNRIKMKRNRDLAL